MISSYHGVGVHWSHSSLCTGATVIGRVVYNPGGSCGPRRQKDFQLFVLHTGECDLLLGEEKISIELDHVYLLLPGEREHFLFSRKSEAHHSWCSVVPESIPGDMRSRLESSVRSISCSITFHQLLSAAFHLGESINAGEGTVIDAIGVALFTEFLNIASRPAKLLAADSYISRAISYMEAHYMDDDCLEKAHNKAGISRNALIKQFSVSLGMTPGCYLWDLRIQRGLSMLINTGLTISEIADRCGFKTPFHFSRKIKESQGISPNLLRKRRWE